MVIQRKIGPLVLGSFGKYMKSGGFHEIRWISWQGLIYTAYPVDLYWFWWKIQHEVDFNHEIRQISCMKFGGYHAWNSVDFMHEIQQISCLKSGGFHEIQQISGPEIWRISCMKSGRFHMQIASFAYEIWQISSMKSGGFHGWSWKMQTFFITLITFFSM